MNQAYQDRRRWRPALFFMMALFMMFPFMNPASAKNIAVVFGISSYQKYVLLDYAGDDAQRVARCFKTLGYATTLRAVDADSGDILAFSDGLHALRLAAQAAREGDTLIFYFAGHGSERDGKDYLLFSDTNPDDFDRTALAVEGTGLDSLEGILSTCRAGSRVLIIDACRDTNRAGAPSGFSKGRLEGGFKERLDQVVRRAPGGRGARSVVMYACSPGQRSREGDEDRAGVFTLALTRALEAAGRGDGLTLGSVFQSIQANMPAGLLGVQTPVFYPQDASGLLLGPPLRPNPFDSPLVQCLKGDQFYNKGQYAQAEPFYREAVRLEPGNANYQNNLGAALDYQGNYAEAEPYYREAVRLEPNSAVYQDNLGGSLHNQKKYAEAEPYFREAVRLESTNARYQHALGDALYWQGKYREAEPYLREAVRLEPGNAAYQDALGASLANENKPEEAEPYLREAVRLERDNAGYQYDLGQTLSNQEKYREAESCYREAVRLEPNNADYQNVMGASLCSQGKYAEGEPYCREAVRLEPKNALYQHNLGASLINESKPEEAEPYLREAVRLEPNNAQYRQDLQNCLKAKDKQ